MTDDLKQITIQLIKQVTGQSNVLSIPRAFIAYTGGLDTAVLLSQIMYWSTRGEDGWFYKSYTDWTKEIALSEYEVRKACKKLKDMGLLTMKLRKVGGGPTLHYHLEDTIFSESFLKFLSIDSEESSVSIVKKLKEPLYTKTTTKTTTPAPEAGAVAGQLTPGQKAKHTLDWFVKEYPKHNGGDKYDVEGKKDMGYLTNFYKRHPEATGAEVHKRMVLFLKSDDTFLVKKAHAIVHFKWNEWSDSAMKKMAQKPRFGEPVKSTAGEKMLESMEMKKCPDHGPWSPSKTGKNICPVCYP